LQERGIDATPHRSKSVDEFARERFDFVITLCAEQVCPMFLDATTKLHWALPDPAAVSKNTDEKLAAFRETAAELTRRLKNWLEHL